MADHVEQAKHCPICKDYSEQPHQLHYGGIACFSCRAFFRRAHQKTKSPSFKCKKNSDCDINTKTRRKCQKCRYVLCLKVGMKPEAVLTDDQKKVRFRNSLKKKATPKANSPSYIFDLGDDDDEDDDDEEDPLEIDEGYGDTSGSSTSPVSASSRPRPLRGEHTYEPVEKRLKLEPQPEMTGPPYSFDLTQANSIPPCPVGKMYLDKLIECFLLTSEQSTINKSDFVTELVAYHSGEHILRRQSFFDCIRALGRQFGHFALMNREFLSLPKDDQRKLLARNTPLFIQFILSQYFTAESGFDQISWLLGSHCPHDLSSDVKQSLRRISLKRLNQHLNLFHIGANLDNFKEFTSRVRLPMGKYKCSAVWCHIILFQSDTATYLEDKEKVHSLCQDAALIIPHSAYVFKCSEKPNVPGMIFTAEAMARFFAQNVIWANNENSDDFSSTYFGSSPDSRSPPSSSDESPNVLVPAYSHHEENWLQGQLEKFDVAIRSAPLGEDLMNEFIMYTMDVPLSKTFMPMSMKIFNERFRRVLKIHPEFNNVSQSEQESLWRSNSIYATALTVAYLESCKTGNEQHQFTTGFDDDNTFLDNMIRGRKMKKLTMNIANKFSGILPEEVLENFERLVKNIGELVLHGHETFKLFSLVLLFSDVENSSKLNELRNNYLNVIRRKHNHLYHLEAQHSDVAFGNYMYSRFNASVCDVKELAMIIRKIESYKPPH